MVIKYNDMDYEIDYDDFNKFLKNQLNKMNKDELIETILNLDENEKLADYFEFELKEYFNKEAYDCQVRMSEDMDMVINKCRSNNI